MKFRRVIMFSIIFTLLFGETPKADFLSDAYKQGVYTISVTKDFKATARLSGAPPTILSIIDSNGAQKYFKKFDSMDEIVNLGYIRNGDSIIIAGEGLIAITKS